MGTANSEQWRKVPGTSCTISNIGRMKNCKGHMMAPRLPSLGASPRYYAAINGVRRSWKIVALMAQVWPEVALRIDMEWMARTREMNGQFVDTSEPLRAMKAASPDPWDKMQLWNVEQDCFNFAQYAPVI